MIYDVSLAPHDFYRIVEETRKVVSTAPNMTAEERDSIFTGGFGHIGDGNLHLTVITPGFEDKDLQKRLYELVDPFVMKFVRDVKGSISAEHGIGY